MLEPAVVSPTALTIARPEPGEYAPYYDRYISLIAGTDILGTLDAQRRQMLLLLSGRDESDGDFRYAPDKWNAKEVLGHVCDTERIFAYRALRIARGDRTPMEGFEQDDYVKNGPFARAPECSTTRIRVTRASTWHAMPPGARAMTIIPTSPLRRGSMARPAWPGRWPTS